MIPLQQNSQPHLPAVSEANHKVCLKAGRTYLDMMSARQTDSTSSDNEDVKRLWSIQAPPMLH